VFNFLATFVLFIQEAHVAFDLFLPLADTVFDLSLHLFCLFLLHRVDLSEAFPMIDLIRVVHLRAPHLCHILACLSHLDRFLHVLLKSVLSMLLSVLLL